MREPNFVNEDSKVSSNEKKNMYFSSVKEMYLSLF